MILNSRSLSISALTVVMGTSPASPDITVVVFRILYIVLNDSSHSLEAWNPSSSGLVPIIFSFISNASSCMRPPVGCKLAAQHFVYHKYIASLSLWNLPWRIRFLLPSKLAQSLRSFSSFFIIVAADVFPILKFFSNISTTDRMIAFFVIEQIYFFA